MPADNEEKRTKLILKDINYKPSFRVFTILKIFNNKGISLCHNFDFIIHIFCETRCCKALEISNF